MDHGVTVKMSTSTSPGGQLEGANAFDHFGSTVTSNKTVDAKHPRTSYTAVTFSNDSFEHCVTDVGLSKMMLKLYG